MVVLLEVAAFGVGPAAAGEIWGNNATAGNVTIGSFDSATGALIRQFIVPKPEAGKGPVRRQPKPGDSADLKARLSAIEDLAEEDADKALPPLLAALNDKDARVRAAAAEALGEVGDPFAIEPLGKGLTGDDDSDVREAAAEALGELGLPNAAPVLRAGLKRTTTRTCGRPWWTASATSEARKPSERCARLWRILTRMSATPQSRRWPR